MFYNIFMIEANCGDPTPDDPGSQEVLEVTFTCRRAWNHKVANLTGPESSTCGTNGTWNPEPPVCILCMLMVKLFWRLSYQFHNW